LDVENIAYDWRQLETASQKFRKSRVNKTVGIFQARFPEPVMAAIPFTPSQLSFKQDTVPINFRVSPGKLLWNDLKLVVSLALYIPLLVLPLRTNNPRSELYLWNIGNLISIASQIMLLISTLTGWSGAIIFILLPVSGAGFTLYALIVLAFLAPGEP
jgi:hypothetical protein